jgi:hypothetical protein
MVLQAEAAVAEQLAAELDRVAVAQAVQLGLLQLQTLAQAVAEAQVQAVAVMLGVQVIVALHIGHKEINNG